MGTRATVLSVNKDGTLQLQAGILKISARQEDGAEGFYVAAAL